mmetsp:Transcript_11142/g.29934  ORF Transcript_11142/g.29934 Transcript_11142/m.29934 type:complete len:249 (+) Transcript_11142:302-1048(+)
MGLSSTRSSLRYRCSERSHRSPRRRYSELSNRNLRRHCLARRLALLRAHRSLELRQLLRASRFNSLSKILFSVAALRAQPAAWRPHHCSARLRKRRNRRFLEAEVGCLEVLCLRNRLPPSLLRRSRPFWTRTTRQALTAASGTWSTMWWTKAPRNSTRGRAALMSACGNKPWLTTPTRGGSCRYSFPAFQNCTRVWNSSNRGYSCTLARLLVLTHSLLRSPLSWRKWRACGWRSSAEDTDNFGSGFSE